MDTAEFKRWIQYIATERSLDTETVVAHIEDSLIKAAEKRFDAEGDFTLSIDRETYEIRAYEDEREIDLSELGRIVANVFKQVFTQGVREDERDNLFEEFEPRLHTIVTGTVSRVETREVGGTGGRPLRELTTVFVQLGRAEAVLPPDEQLLSDTYHAGSVVRAYLMKVEKRGSRLRLVLSRTHANFVRELFFAEVPEIADGLIEIRGIVREAGRRTKIAVASTDARVDPVGSCVGMRGSRITKVADELGGEKIDIIPWDEDPAQFIINALKPATILSVAYDGFRDRARVVVAQDMLPLAIGRGGQNVRLAARLTRYKVDVTSEQQVTEARQAGMQQLQMLIDAGLLNDFQREIFLDSFLDTLAVIAAQTPTTLIEGLEEIELDEVAAEQLIAHAAGLLDEEGRKERDEIVQRREESERREAEEAAAEAEAAAAAAAEAALAMTGVEEATEDEA